MLRESDASRGAKVRSTLSVAVGLLSPRERWQAASILAITVVSGFIDSVVVTMVIPLVYAIVDPERIERSDAWHRLLVLIGPIPISKVLLYVAATLIVGLILNAALAQLVVYLSERHSGRCRNRLSGYLLRRCVEAPYSWQVRQNTADLMRWILESVRAWRQHYIFSAILLFQAIITALGPASAALAFSPVQGLLALLIAGSLASVAVYILRSKMEHLGQEQLRLYSETSRNLLQILNGAREVKVSGQQEFFISRFSTPHAGETRLVTILRVASALPQSLFLLVGQIGFITVGVLLWWQGFDGAAITTQLAVLAMVVSRVLPALNMLNARIGTMAHYGPMVREIRTLIDELDALEAADQRLRRNDRVPTHWKTVALENVHLRYPMANTDSLSGINLALERGRHYGIVGRSGAGKSSLVNVLLGLADPTSGQVLIDGLSLTTIDPSDWCRRFGYVPQDPFIFDSSLKENVAFCDDFEPTRFERALVAAQLTELVSGLPLGIESPLGERGRLVSGGQAQRIAIARALYRGSEILFLDEATGALDQVTEDAIMAEIDLLKGSTTAFIITHRIVSLRRCDCIFVLEEGRIVAQGNYDELMNGNPLFRALAARKIEDTVS